ncbi:MAG TPA: c-type cytochrome [Bryobacteraceae bacterium]|jgi:mono/diheme cytochrome c family protein|nr:c-type cytochrome [Bryobacteraceae bacterium]
MIWLSVLLFLQVAAPNPQIERGQTLFYAETGCGNCHALKGRGAAVGPDLKVLGRVGVRALVTAIRASRTEYVETIKLKGGDSFPGIKVASADAATLQYYDLSKTPPELRKFAPADVESKSDNSSWKHPPAVGGYNNQQIADIVAYIRWATAGERKAVDPSDVE